MTSKVQNKGYKSFIQLFVLHTYTLYSINHNSPHVILEWKKSFLFLILFFYFINPYLFFFLLFKKKKTLCAMKSFIRGLMKCETNEFGY